MEYNLPYDYSRCEGKTTEEVHPTCLDCMRRLSPGRPNEWGQSYMLTVPDEDGKCSVKISVERWRNR